MTDFSARPGQIDPIFVTVKTAAGALGLSEWQVYQLLDAQKIESRYQGRRRLVVVDSLRHYARNLPTEAPEKDEKVGMTRPRPLRSKSISPASAGSGLPRAPIATAGSAQRKTVRPTRSTEPRWPTHRMAGRERPRVPEGLEARPPVQQPDVRPT